MIFKEVKWTPKTKATHEEVPQEDLWEDGEISQNTCMIKIFDKVCCKGDWVIIRRKK